MFDVFFRLKTQTLVTYPGTLVSTHPGEVNRVSRPTLVIRGGIGSCKEPTTVTRVDQCDQGVTSEGRGRREEDRWEG